MAGRGRKPGFKMTDEHRTKIANSQILKCLVDHAIGKREMSATQIAAGLGLLRKVMPDLAATTLEASITTEPMTDGELDERIEELQREVRATQPTH